MIKHGEDRSVTGNTVRVNVISPPNWPSCVCQCRGNNTTYYRDLSTIESVKIVRLQESVMLFRGKGRLIGDPTKRGNVISNLIYTTS